MQALEKHLQAKPRKQQLTRLVNQHQETLIARETLPAGSVRASSFAEQHSVPAKTFKYHLLTGLKRERPAYLACLREEHPTEVERWLAPEQQALVLTFWRKHGVAFT